MKDVCVTILWVSYGAIVLTVGLLTGSGDAVLATFIGGMIPTLIASLIIKKL